MDIGPLPPVMIPEQCIPPRACACFDVDEWERFYIRAIIGLTPKEDDQ